MILRASRIAGEMDKLASTPIVDPEPVMDNNPHGRDGRLRRIPHPGKVRVKKIEGPRAYAPRI